MPPSGAGALVVVALSLAGATGLVPFPLLSGALAEGTRATLPGGAAFAQARQGGGAAILVLNRDRMYAESAFGGRILADIEQARRALLKENRQIEAELVEEERRLTDKRPGMDAGAFRKLAEDFDTRVETIRQTQDAKAATIADQADKARQIFFETAGPVLRDLVHETDAVLIVDQRSVIASVEAIDITTLAIKRIDARLGADTGLENLKDLTDTNDTKRRIGMNRTD